MFEENIIGQKPLIQSLRDQIDKGRIPHSQLFIGKTGYGSLAVALEYVASIICTDRQNGAPCGVCAGCHKMKKLSHPDVYFSYPFLGSTNVAQTFARQWVSFLGKGFYPNLIDWVSELDSKSSTPNINAKECLEIVKRFSLKSFESEHKVMIMWLPEYLGGEGNRLLKLIEEPPEGSIFIFVAENEDAILNTIVSRCQITKIHRIQPVDLSDYIEKEHGLSSVEAGLMAKLCQGNVLELGKYLTDNFKEEAGLFLGIMRLGYSLKGTDMMDVVDAITRKPKESQKVILQYGYTFIRNLMLYNQADQIPNLTEEENQAIKKLAQIIDITQINSIITLINDSIFAIERNANAKILFTDLMIQLHLILRRGKLYSSIQS